MRAAKGDDADDVSAHRHRRAVSNSINRAIEAESRFIEPVILYNDDPRKFDRTGQRHAMLGDVRLVLQRIKLDFHNYL